MKKKAKLPMVPAVFRICYFTVLLSAIFMAAACSGGPSAREAPGFSDILGKDWRLIRIRTETDSINLDREVMDVAGVGDAFTLRFEEDRINGVALPNRYFGPYVREGQAISFKGIASTLMASSNELDILNENEYFGYLDRVQGWALRLGRLELHSATPDGQQAILIFSE
ncbi:META domain-containing protein [Treponema sp. TIM-1]|uniref:META domain-containing protein n=1 Tax=Treponema sp. TIM-1 TaxID=2898417 RepID=UPI003980BE78